jgi:hypothetical protein
MSTPASAWFTSTHSTTGRRRRPGPRGRCGSSSRTARSPRSTPRCPRTDEPADLALDVRELGAAYLGGTRLGTLAAAGLVHELRPGALTRLSAAMTWDPAPWCPQLF